MIDHMLMFYALKAFFSLYFERQRDTEQKCFGHLFLDNRKELLISLERRLSSYDTRDSALENWKLVVNAFAVCHLV